MDFRFAIETGVPRREAFAWMTDFGGGDHHGARWGRGATRTIVSQSERQVEIRDDWPRRTIHLSVLLNPPNGWRIRGRTRGARWEATVMIENRAEGGSRVVADYAMEGEGLGKALVPLFRRRIARTFQRDWATHVAEMEEDLGHAAP